MSSPRRFYEMMNYPVPLRQEFFAFQDVDIRFNPQRPFLPVWSRVKPPSEQMNQYLALIQKYQWIRSRIPYIQTVYLANSITFNALKEESNIDFFIVTAPGRLWIARVCTLAFIAILGLLPTNKHRKLKFACNFRVTTERQDLKDMLLHPSDPYLIYRIAHLVPIYYRDLAHHEEIFEQNKRLQYYLTHFTGKQTIFLGVEVMTGTAKAIYIIEKLLNNILGDLIEYLCRVGQSIYLRCRKRMHPQHGQHLIFRQDFFKIYDDKRKRYALCWELAKKTADEKAETI